MNFLNVPSCPLIKNISESSQKICISSSSKSDWSRTRQKKIIKEQFWDKGKNILQILKLQLCIHWKQKMSLLQHRLSSQKPLPQPEIWIQEFQPICWSTWWFCQLYAGLTYKLPLNSSVVPHRSHWLKSLLKVLCWS